MNYFSLVISTFPSTFSHHSPQAEICISSNSSCWTLKPPLKWGCSLQCFTLSHKTDDCISHTAQGSQHRQPGSSLQQRCWAAACLSAPRDTGHPRTYGLVWAVTMGSSTDWSAQGRRGMECVREWGLPRAKCSTHCAAGAGPQGRDGISHIFPRLLRICMHA